MLLGEIFTQAAPAEIVGTDTLWHPMAPVCRVKRSSGFSLPGRGLSLRKIVSAAILGKTLPFSAWQLGPRQVINIATVAQ